WFPDAFRFVNVNLGGPYTSLVDQWITFERISNWQTKNTGLAKLNRPMELTTWINYGRYNKKRIKITPERVHQFAVNFWIWWSSLQPSWRAVGEDNRPLAAKEMKDDWKSLDHYGQNGWLSLVVCLRWWGEGLMRVQNETLRKEGIDDWLMAIEDMAIMLGGLISYK
ncbi:hypothetical protein F5050DRAFT_1551295, partial [Lentinula boryana]